MGLLFCTDTDSTPSGPVRPPAVRATLPAETIDVVLSVSVWRWRALGQ
jgi:hypothetical protein